MIPSPANAAPPGASTSILLVDDDARNLDVLESILSGAALRLVRAQTPDEALLALVHDEFACIVLDIQLPTMNGVELARLIKTRKRCQHIPIIFLTAFFLEERDILEGYGAGAVDYLTKPINPTILKSKVGVFVDLFRATRALSLANSALEAEIQQRQKAEEALKESNSRLEVRVEERTADLLHANDELRVSEERYRQLIRSLPAAVYTTDAAGRLTFYNEAAVRLWGREPEIGRELWPGGCNLFRLDGTDLPYQDCPMARALAENRAVRDEEILIERPGGERRHVLPYPEPIRDAAGKLAGAVNMLIDVTEQRQVERAARQLAAIVEFSDDAIISKDLNSIIMSWNESAHRLFGYTAQEIVGKSVYTLIPEDRYDEEAGILQRLAHAEPTKHFETIRRRKDGTLIEVSLTISPIKSPDGKIIGASKIVRDISERRRTEQQLKRTHEELLAASRAKDDFLATLSHELRTPLNPILLVASDAVHNQKLPPDVRAEFEMIFKNVELEARLIDDLLDLTRITRGKITLHKQLVDIRAVLQDAVATVRDEVAQKRITLDLRFEAAHHFVFADPVRLQQIFWNLLRNAAKFTPENGGISVVTRAGDGTRLMIEIADTGIGMTAAEINGLFKVFSQGDHASSNAHQFGGLGLGLAIAQKLAEFHAGDIRASSAGRGKGSAFTVDLPLAPAEKRGSRAQPAAPAPELSPALPVKTSLTILLVEDHEPTRTSLAHLLMRRAYKVVTASSLAEAQALADEHTFNLLISDIGLPDGNGYDLMARLKKNGLVRGIALTGYGMEQDIARSQEVGFVAHLTKPVRMQSLEAAINAAVELNG
jgi:PAS domain S-box-containing protein